jgi:hypothetical protein
VELSNLSHRKLRPTPPNSIQRVRSVYRDPLPFLAAGKQRVFNSAGPGRTNLDSSVFKHFTPAKVHMQLRGEFFALVNRPQSGDRP